MSYEIHDEGMLEQETPFWWRQKKLSMQKKL